MCVRSSTRVVFTRNTLKSAHLDAYTLRHGLTWGAAGVSLVQLWVGESPGNTGTAFRTRDWSEEVDRCMIWLLTWNQKLGYLIFIFEDITLYNEAQFTDGRKCCKALLVFTCSYCVVSPHTWTYEYTWTYKHEIRDHLCASFLYLWSTEYNISRLKSNYLSRTTACECSPTNPLKERWTLVSGGPCTTRPLT